MRVKTGPYRRRRHKKILKLAKGYRGTKSRLYKSAHEAVLHAGEYAFVGRKLRKRAFRRLWIQRINAAVRAHGLNYSSFIHRLNQAKISLNRKILARWAFGQPERFAQLIKRLSGQASNGQD